MLVQHRILTAEPQRAQMIFCLAGSHRQTKTCSYRKIGVLPFAIRKCLGSDPVGMRVLIQSPSPDWIRKKSHSAISAVLR